MGKDTALFCYDAVDVVDEEEDYNAWRWHGMKHGKLVEAGTHIPRVLFSCFFIVMAARTFQTSDPD